MVDEKNQLFTKGKYLKPFDNSPGVVVGIFKKGLKTVAIFLVKQKKCYLTWKDFHLEKKGKRQKQVIHSEKKKKNKHISWGWIKNQINI